METVVLNDPERDSETKRNIRRLNAVEALEFANEKREIIIRRMIMLARERGMHLHNDYYYIGGFMINVAGRSIRLWRKGMRAEKRVDAEIILNEDGNRWWKSLSIADAGGDVELSDELVPTIKEGYGKWLDHPYTETVHVLGDAGTGILISVCIHFDMDRSVSYERDKVTGEYEVTNKTGEILSHLGLPDDLRKAKYVQGIPIKDLLEINFEEAALRIEANAGLDEVMEAVGAKEE